MPRIILKAPKIAQALVAGAAVLALGACVGSPTVNPDMVSIVPGPDVPAGTKGPNGEPLCREVGGYEAYYKKTRKACFSGPDAYNDINYSGGPDRAD